MLPSASVWERALLPEGHRHLLLPKSGGLLLLASFRLVQRFLWISWSCLCMKSPSSQQWESSSSSPGLRAPSLFFGLLLSASWLFGGGWSPCTCVGQVLLVLGE